MAPAYASPKRAAKTAALGSAPAGATENSKGRARKDCWSRRGANSKYQSGPDPVDKRTAAKISAAGRANSKKALVFDMLRRDGGATLEEIMQATGWLRHSCRGFLSIASKTCKIESEKTDSGRRYRIAK